MSLIGYNKTQLKTKFQLIALPDADYGCPKL